jgi:hypothetical protein
MVLLVRVLIPRVKGVSRNPLIHTGQGSRYRLEAYRHRREKAAIPKMIRTRMEYRTEVGRVIS